MSRDLIFLPVLVQVALTLAIYVVLIRAKIRAIKAGECDQARRALYDDAFPEYVLKINNNLRNQFELPVLFYVVALVLWALDAVNVAALVAAWAFVASRLVHAWIHCTTNVVAHRRRVFTVGWWILAAMLLFAVFEAAVSSA
ncbi:MAG: MAPEG family protein [Steroidobacteraceae bacterium]|nr:MAPEG family protein [Steroidobacteraceae bacterium]